MTTRRAFLTSGIALLAAPLAAEAQQPSKVYRIGYLSATPPAQGLAVFIRRLKELGYEEGRSLLVETRSADGRAERYPALAAELLSRKPES